MGFVRRSKVNEFTIVKQTPSMRGFEHPLTNEDLELLAAVRRPR